MIGPGYYSKDKLNWNILLSLSKANAYTPAGFSPVTCNWVN